MVIVVLCLVASLLLLVSSLYYYNGHSFVACTTLRMIIFLFTKPEPYLDPHYRAIRNTRPVLVLSLTCNATLSGERVYI